MNFITALVPFSATLYGIKENIDGVLTTCKGNIIGGAKKIFIGMTATNLGAKITGMIKPIHQDLTRLYLLGGTVAVAADGIHNVAKGIQKRSLGQAARGVSQLAIGVAGAAFVTAIDSIKILAATQAALLAIPSCYVAFRGVKDIARGFYLKGGAETLVGIGGIACSGYYAYKELIERNVPEPYEPFLQEHKEEINTMCDIRGATGEWESIGHGGSKFTVSHPEMPHYVVKMVHQLPVNDFSVLDLEIQFNNIPYAKKVIEDNNYQHLVIPESYLIKSYDCPFLIETKFNFLDDGFESDYHRFLGRTRNAEMELDDFIKQSGFCDIPKNAKPLKETNGATFGIFDFDHREDEVC